LKYFHPRAFAEFLKSPNGFHLFWKRFYLVLTKRFGLNNKKDFHLARICFLPLNIARHENPTCCWTNL